MRHVLFTLLTVFLLLSISSFAAKWRVNNTPGIDAHFSSFVQAHNTVSAGDTLMFEGSNLLYGDLDTLFKRLVIIGPGYFLDENDTTNDNILPATLNYLYVDSAAKGSIIMGMSVTGGFDCLQIDADNMIIERNHVNGRITFCQHKPIKNGVISKNFVTEIGTRWGSKNLFAAGLLITNNIVKNNISFNTLSTCTITNNSVEGNIVASSSIVKNNFAGYMNAYDGTVYQYNIVAHLAPSGPGNIGNVGYDGIFMTEVESTDGAYKLTESSPAKNAGEGNIDCGAFGGNDPYILSGYPPFPVIYNAIVPSTGTSELLIKIEARSQK